MPEEDSNHPAYAGNFRHAIDSKHRVTIPARWRQGEEDPFFLLPSQDNLYLSVLPPSEFRKVNQTVNNDPGISPADRRWFARFYFSQAQHCVLDKQGRLLLPDEFCRLAALTGETVLIGTFDRFEIWSPERWEQAKLRGGQHLSACGRSHRHLNGLMHPPTFSKNLPVGANIGIWSSEMNTEELPVSSPYCPANGTGSRGRPAQISSSRPFESAIAPRRSAAFAVNPAPLSCFPVDAGTRFSAASISVGVAMLFLCRRQPTLWHNHAKYPRALGRD